MINIPTPAPNGCCWEKSQRVRHRTQAHGPPLFSLPNYHFITFLGAWFFRFLVSLCQVTQKGKGHQPSCGPPWLLYQVLSTKGRQGGSPWLIYHDISTKLWKQVWAPRNRPQRLGMHTAGIAETSGPQGIQLKQLSTHPALPNERPVR